MGGQDLGAARAQTGWGWFSTPVKTLQQPQAPVLMMQLSHHQVWTPGVGAGAGGRAEQAGSGPELP